MAGQRWTITRSAAALHRDVLGPAGFVRRGTTCAAEDFLRREVTFRAGQFRGADDRTLQVTFGLAWTAVPDSFLGGWVEGEFLQPLVEDDALDRRLVDVVAGPVLDHLRTGTDPDQLVTVLLQPGSLERPGLAATYSDARQLAFAAQGAMVLGDEERCRAAVALMRAEAERADDDVDPALRDGRFVRWHDEEVQALRDAWETRHGTPLRLPG